MGSKGTFIILLLMIAGSVLSGQSPMKFGYADSASAALYEAEEWEALVKLGKAAQKEKLSFFQLHRRVGVAHSRLGDYRNAVTLLEKASAKNEFYPGLKKELYIAKTNIASGLGGRAMLADPVFSKDIQAKQFVPADFIYLEGGIKLSSRPDSVGNLGFGALGINSLLGYKASLYSQYSFSTQKYFWGNFLQHELLFMPKIQFNNKLRLESAVRYFRLGGKYQGANVFSEELETAEVLLRPGLVRYDTTRSQTNSKHEGDISLNGLSAYMGFSKRFKAFDFHPYFAITWYQNKITGETVDSVNWEYVYTLNQGETGGWTGDTVYYAPFKTDTTVWQFQYGLKVGYTLPFNKLGLQVGAGLSLYSNNEKTGVIVNPFIRWNIQQKVWFGLEYHYANTSNLIEGNGLVLNNSVDPIRHKISLMASGEIAKGLNLYGIYQFENRREIQMDQHYLFSNFILGLKIKL